MFSHWKETSNYVIALQSSSLEELKEKLSQHTTVYSFVDEDVGPEITAIAFFDNEYTRKYTSSIPLAK